VNQIVHRRIHYDEALSLILLYIKNRREQHTSRTHKQAARLEQETAAGRANDGGMCLGIRRELKRCLVCITNAYSPAKINAVQTNLIPRHLTNVGCQPDQGAAKGSQCQNLRADVSCDPAPHNPSRISMQTIEAPRLFPFNAEFLRVVPR
jgi:hypothetical protein